MTTENFPVNKLISDAGSDDPENGDLFNEDTGDYYGLLDLHVTEPTLEEPTPAEVVPAQMCLFFNGFWYIYKMDSMREEGEEDA